MRTLHVLLFSLALLGLLAGTGCYYERIERDRVSDQRGAPGYHGDYRHDDRHDRDDDRDHHGDRYQDYGRDHDHDSGRFDHH